MVGYAVNGKMTEMTKQLTVAFRAPENLQVTATVDPANNYKVNVSATALYETNFKVYFGENPNETPVTFLEGQTVSYVYATTGTYNVRVVAQSGGAATSQQIVPVTIVDPILLPLTFESPTINYNWFNFDGGNVTVINNPQANGINTSSKVAKMVKNAGQPWGGSFLTLSSNIDFSANKIFRMKVFSPRVGARVLLKVENSANGSINFEKEVATTVANAWEDMVFDYRAINAAQNYNRIVIIFDNGTVGNGSANFTFLMDDIRLVNSLPLSLPLDFESTSTNYNWFDFDGGNATVVTNPQSNGINTSSRVGRMIKNAGQPWGGSFLTLNQPMDFSTNKVFRMKVFSPRVGAKVLLKVENSANAGINFEKEVTTSIANAWEDLVFDYSGINAANVYDRVVLIFELGTPGDGSANFTFLFDDIRLTNTFPVAIPLNFEYPVTYGWFDFDGGNVTVVNNSQSGGINTSAKVAKMIKNPGQPWGGSFLTLTQPINFAISRTFKMKVFSPRAGARVLLKVENSSNPSQNFEREVATTVAGAWEELTFDYGAINTSLVYDRVVVIFDLGTPGDGSANFTFLFDDLRLH
ncbi:MAG: PKD domain-containing protein [Chitinophagia bacterium]|nr:PKD domain-containing protein [Chitinophagia bacterium]